MIIRDRNARLSGFETRPERGGELLAELVILYPQVSEVSYSETLKYIHGENCPRHTYPGHYIYQGQKFDGQGAGTG